MRVENEQIYKLQQSQQDQLTQNSTELNNTLQSYRLAVLGYLLYGLGLVFGITALIGVIVNHTCIERTKQTIAYSHCIWQIVSFWLLVTGVVTAFMMRHGGHGTSILVACLIWWLMSLLTGAWFLARNKPIPWIAGDNRFQHG